MTLLNKKTIFNLLFISFFLIFFHLIPINVETQPHLSFIFALLLFVTAKSTNYKFKKDILFLYLLLSILLAYTCLQFLLEFSFNPILEFIKYLIGPIIYLAIRNNYITINFKIFRLVIFSLSFFALLNLITPNIYEFFFGRIIPRFSGNIAGGIRGITILTPEPSYFAIFQIILLIIIEKQLTNLTLTTVEISKLKVLKFILIVISFLTKSAFVILISFIFLLPKKINFIKLFKIAFIVVILLFLFYNLFTENRLSQILILLYTLISEGNFDLSNFLFNQESSGGTRIIVNFLAIFSILIHPFGSGFGSFSNMISQYAVYFDLNISKHEVLGSDLLAKIYPQTYFANLCNDIGIFSLLLFPVIFLNNDNSNKGYNIKRNLCLFIMIFFQSQITNPAFWFLIAISKIPHDKKILK
jgi:hypothetical protein